VKGFGESVNIWRSSGQKYSVFFFTHDAVKIIDAGLVNSVIFFEAWDFVLKSLNTCSDL